jgi:hypothetical protein
MLNWFRRKAHKLPQGSNVAAAGDGIVFLPVFTGDSSGPDSEGREHHPPIDTDPGTPADSGSSGHSCSSSSCGAASCGGSGG